MNQALSPNALIRVMPAIVALAESRSSFYAKAAAGILTSPIKTGLRSAALPVREIEALNAARIAGVSEAGMKALVQRLHAERVQVGV